MVVLVEVSFSRMDLRYGTISRAEEAEERFSRV